MNKKNIKSKYIKPLKWYPSKIYNLGKLDKKAIAKENNESIKHYSKGISINKIHKNIRPLRKGYYALLDDDIGGDAPKDFVSVYEYGEVKKENIKNWHKHIAKVGHKWYPLESISEHLLNRIGEILNLNMASSQLRIIHGQLRFLSKYFLKKDEIMVHGAQIYSTYLLENDDRFVKEIEAKKMSRELLTFQFTDDAIKFMFPQEYEKIMNHLVELLVFDAITGNNDRHFYNWAVITNIEDKNSPKFSPIYDSARGLFWNRSEDVIEKKFYEGKGNKLKINQAALKTYLQSSRPKIGWEGWKGIKEINHFELIAKINQNYLQHKNTCNSLIKNIHLQSIFELLDCEFITFYSPKRLFLIKECLRKRFEILTNLCKLNSYD